VIFTEFADPDTFNGNQGRYVEVFNMDFDERTSIQLVQTHASIGSTDVDTITFDLAARSYAIFSPGRACPACVGFPLKTNAHLQLKNASGHVLDEFKTRTHRHMKRERVVQGYVPPTPLQGTLYQNWTSTLQFTTADLDVSDWSEAPFACCARITDPPSGAPSAVPTAAPSGAPSAQPTQSPRPSVSPSAQPSDQPSASPSDSPTAAPSDAPTALLYPIYLYIDTDFAMTYNDLLGALDQTSMNVFGFSVARSQMIVSLRAAHTDYKEWIVRVITAFEYTGDLTAVVDETLSEEILAYTQHWVITKRATYGEAEYELTCSGIQSHFITHDCCATDRFECSRIASLHQSSACTCPGI
tara:strand:- start:2511 stop:3578 length:1068 start_codon:yes stop_codon:yes gene_type:complete